MHKPFGIARSAGILVAALACTSASASAVDRARAKLPSSGEIKLFQSTNRVLVMVQREDGDLIPMVFDTGSDGNTIDRSLVRRLKMKRIGSVLEIDGTTGKQRTLPQMAVTNLTLGGLKVPSIDAASVDLDRSDAMGIISPEIFTDAFLYLDLANDRAALKPRATTPPPPGTAIDYVRDIPTVHIVMPDGSTLPAHFDTGYNAALSLPISMMDKVPLEAPAKIVGRFKSINTEGPVFGGRIKGNIKIGPVTLENPHVTFLGDLANIGLPVIRQVTLVIDPSANRNWVLPAGSAPASGE